jgi:anthranilate synthase component II
VILLIDNYDSFTYNLLHYVEQVTNEKIVVKRNDEIITEDVSDYQSIIFSPGPGLPADAGRMCEIIRKYSSTKPMLGICLGHQAIAECYGFKLENLKTVLHGVQRTITVTSPSNILFKELPHQFASGHYHSWVVSNKIPNPAFETTAIDEVNNIMAISHKKFPLHGVQFHPESIMTSNGLMIIRNWVEYYN